MGKKSIGNPSHKQKMTSEKGVTWFLGIAVNEYDGDFSPLNNAVKDMDEISYILRDDFGVEQFIYLRNKEVTPDNVTLKLSDLQKEIGKDDSLIIYYSGHGAIDAQGKGYWVPYDARRDQHGIYIRNSVILEDLANFNAKHILLICDACFGGSILQAKGADFHVDFERIFAHKSRWAICSGRKDEVVFDGNPGENSPFATAIKRVLATIHNRINIAAFANMLRSTTAQVYRETYPTVQTPPIPYYGGLNINGHEQGEYIFIRRNEEEVFWAEILKRNTLDAYMEYLTNFRNGRHNQEADEAILNLTATDLGSDYTRQDFEVLDFLIANPQILNNNERIKERLRKIADKLRTGSEPIATPAGIRRPELIPELVEVKGASNVISLISDDFFIGKYPVTLKEYKVFAQNTGRALVGNEGEDLDHPVVNISWKDAVSYCEWLSVQTNKKFRLPFESEWELAAMGGDKSSGFPFAGSRILDEVGWFKDNSDFRTHPVGQKTPNELGLFDMCGNVWEMCRPDLMPYSQLLTTGEEVKITLCGGSWLRPAEHCRISYKEKESTDFQGDDVGFRIVMED